MLSTHHRWLAFVALLSIAGCSGANHPATAPVSGTLKYKGSPVEGATVIFSPAAGGRPATGHTDAQGHYALSMFDENDGAVPGDYQVTVAKSEIARPTMTDTERNTYIQDHQGVPPPQAPSKSLLPEKYLSVSSSDLKATVKPGDNDIPLELKD